MVLSAHIVKTEQTQSAFNKEYHYDWVVGLRFHKDFHSDSLLFAGARGGVGWEPPWSVILVLPIPKHV